MSSIAVILNMPGVQVWNADFRKQMVNQCCLCYNDLTLRYFLVINNFQTGASDKLNKYVHNISLLCSICRNLYWTKSIRGQYLFSVFIWRKLLLNNINYCKKLIVTMLHRKSRTLIRTKISKNGLMNGSRRNEKIFIGVVFINCRKDWKTCITRDVAYF